MQNSTIESPLHELKNQIERKNNQVKIKHDTTFEPQTKDTKRNSVEGKCSVEEREKNREPCEVNIHPQHKTWWWQHHAAGLPSPRQSRLVEESLWKGVFRFKKRAKLFKETPDQSKSFQNRKDVHLPVRKQHISMLLMAQSKSRHKCH